MVAAQEELDWYVYRLYGLVDEDLTIPLGRRARDRAGGAGVRGRAGPRGWPRATRRPRGSPGTVRCRSPSCPPTGRPTTGPLCSAGWTRSRSNPAIRLLERPEFKRRWASESWESMEKSALQGWLLDRLEEPALWSDQSGPRVLSVSQLATAMRGEDGLRSVLGLWAGNADVDLAAGTDRAAQGGGGAVPVCLPVHADGAGEARRVGARVGPAAPRGRRGEGDDPGSPEVQQQGLRESCRTGRLAGSWTFPRSGSSRTRVPSAQATPPRCWGGPAGTTASRPWRWPGC